MGIFSRRPGGADSDGLGLPDFPGAGTDLLEREDLSQVEDGDHERFSHYVLKDKIVESAVTGKPVRALCGKKWVPGRDPEKFPICPTCKELHAKLKQ